MATLASDSFTGSNGSAWNSGTWASTLSTTGATATIQGNRGRIYAGTLTNYDGKRVQAANGISVADTEQSLLFAFQSAGNDGAFEVWARGDAQGSFDYATGYALIIDRSNSQFKIQRANAYSYSTIAGPVSFTFTNATDYRCKFYCKGTTLKAKVWAASGGEPGTYDLTVTDSVVSRNGTADLSINGGNAGGNTIDIDDYLLTDAGGGTLVATGSITPAGVLRKSTVKTLVGTITPTGVGTFLKVVVRVFTAGITSTGVFIKTSQKNMSGSIAATGVLAKAAQKKFTGAISTVAGVMRLSFVKVFTGTITPVGTATATFVGRIFGRPGIVDVVLKPAGWLRMRIRRG